MTKGMWSVGVSTVPEIVVQGDIAELDDEDILEMAEEYLEQVRFVPEQVERKDGHAVVRLVPRYWDEI